MLNVQFQIIQFIPPIPKIAVQTNRKNNYQLISRILFLNYHLSAPNIAAEMLLPTRKLGRAALKRLPMWHYSMQGLPTIIVANNCRELLPHVFTLIPNYGTVIFCGTFCWRRNATRLLAGALPCAVRTFLLPNERETIARLVVEAKVEQEGETCSEEAVSI